MLRRQYSELNPSASPLESDRGKLTSSFSLDSGTIPSAPLLETSPFKNPVTQLELTVSASSLLNLDQLTRSDPLCVVFLQDSTTAEEWIELGRTESIPNNLNPEWKTKFLVDYRFEEKQMLTFMVFDKDCAKYSLDNHDFLGVLECSLAEIVSSPHSKLTRPLKLPAIHSTAKRESKISILADEADDCKKFIRMACSVSKSFARSSSLSKFKPAINKKLFMNISKQLVDGSWILLHRTNRALAGDQTLSLTFAPINLRYSSVCRQGNLEMPLRFQLHQVKQSFRGKSSKLIAETVTNFIEVSEKCSDGTTVELKFTKKTSDEIKIDFDKLTICDFKIESQKTFMDHLQDGLQIKFAVAIDFTASNGEPTSHSSLHYKHGKRDNPYVMTLKIVGEILQEYSSSKQFYAYGFGAKGYPIANRVNNKFSLNFKETNPLCQGIDGVITSYYRALQRVKLFGPTCFAPVIREMTAIARSSLTNSPNQEYYVLLILTDGIVCDPETTMDALVQASDVPLSVIIIGIGDEDFTTMERFDSDEKLLKSRSNKLASRDIVQFVELRRYVNFKSVVPISEGSKTALARSVLAELPQQVVTWMNLYAENKPTNMT